MTAFTVFENPQDTMTLQFINPMTQVVVGNLQLVSGEFGDTMNVFDNYTSVNFEKDYFTPSNKLAFTIEDDRIQQITQFLQVGWKIQLSINGNPNMVGYIFDYDLEYTRNGGTKLTIKCKDLLEYMAQGSIYPNMGIDKQRTNFHFKSTDTLDYAIRTIANAFEDVTGTTLTTVIDDEASLTFATGFKVGIRVKGKTPKGRQKSLTSQLNHITAPTKGESYLAYIVRLAKMAGCNVRLDNTDDSIIILKPPTYDRTETSPFKLVHYVSAPNNQQNNVLSAHYHFGLDKQPSVVIVEANSRGDNQFYQSIIKGVAVNEMTGYLRPGVQAFTNAVNNAAPSTASPLESVTTAIGVLTNGQLGTGYVLAPFNTQLYNLRNQLSVDIDTQVSLPFYTVASSAHTVDECSYAASQILAEAQDKYIEFRYRVQGWTMPGTAAVWQPDMMVEVTEEMLSSTPGTPVVFNMWIRQVNFLKSRGGGTETEIVCTLPYTHNFEILA